MSKAYLSIGTNVGKRKENINYAIKLLRELENIHIQSISKTYETEPWGYINQDKFLNICVCIITKLMPYELLYKCQEIEEKLKRVRDIRWGPRTIDVDILIYDDIISDDKDLTVPHPRLHERAFVLVPLRDINKDIVIKNHKINYWLEKLDANDVKEYIGDE